LVDVKMVFNSVLFIVVSSLVFMLMMLEHLSFKTDVISAKHANFNCAYRYRIE